MYNNIDDMATLSRQKTKNEKMFVLRSTIYEMNATSLLPLLLEVRSFELSFKDFLGRILVWALFVSAVLAFTFLP